MEQTNWCQWGKKAGVKSRMKQLIKSKLCKLLITAAKWSRHFVLYILPVKTFKGYRTNQPYNEDIFYPKKRNKRQRQDPIEQI
jgi:hypothetical protein